MNRMSIWIILLSILGAACPVNGATVLLDFEDLPLGNWYAHPSHPNPPGPPYFTTSGVTVRLTGAVSNGTAQIVPGTEAGTVGQALWLRVVDVEFGFVTARTIEFEYGYHGGTVDIEVNGAVVTALHIDQLNGQVIGGYLVQVTSPLMGTLSLTPDTQGIITSFHIGGQELAIDNVRLSDVVLPPAAPQVDPPGAGPAGGLGYLSIREVIDNGPIADQNACYASLDSNAGTIVLYDAPVLNILDSGSNGHFDGDDTFGVVTAGHRAYGAVDDLSLAARGTIRIPPGESGVYTFGVNSDDGFLLHFPGCDFTSAVNGELVTFASGTALRFFGERAADDTLGTIDLPAGDHAFWLTYHERAGGAAVELYAAKGSPSAFDPTVFRLVGHRSTGEVPVPGFSEMVTVTASSPGGWSEGQILNLQNARDALAEGQAQGTNTVREYTCVNHSDPQDGEADPDLAGLFPGDFAFPNDTEGNEDDFAVKVTGLIDIPVAGTYQIGFNSDDGVSLQISGYPWRSILADATGNAVIMYDQLINDSLTGWSLTAGEIDLPEGRHPFEAIMFDHTGGAFFELFGRGMALASGVPDASWHLLQASGAQVTRDPNGLQLVEPPRATHCENIGMASTCASGESKLIYSRSDSLGNKLELSCNGAFNLCFTPAGASSGCTIGHCSYVQGENVGWACFGPDGQFLQITWLNYEGHQDPHDPASPLVDQSSGPGQGYEERDTYVYHVASHILYKTYHMRQLLNGKSDFTQPWVVAPYKAALQEVCPATTTPCLPSSPAVAFTGNGPRTTPLQFFGNIQGGGQVVLDIHGEQVVVSTTQGMNGQQLAQQVVQQFNRHWQEGPRQQQTKSAASDPNRGQVVLLRNVDEQEISVQTIDEPGLGFVFSPDPVGDMPDLIPVKAPGSTTFCELHEGVVLVYVRNQGSVEAARSEVRIEFSTGAGTHRTLRTTTGPISPGDTHIVGFLVPDACWSPDCHFTITVDALNEVPESSESNNTVEDTCIG